MDSFLTETQIKVLELRKKGLTQDKIADQLNTSRANISMIEKRARENVEKAKETLKIYNNIIAPLKLIIPEGTDVLDIPKQILEVSDVNDIIIPYAQLEMLELIHKSVPECLQNRVVKKSFTINILENGELSFMG
jgi:Tfx family DNA-binding protein